MHELENHSLLFEALKLGIVYQNRAGQIIKANQAAENILGLKINQMQSHAYTYMQWKTIHMDGSDYPGETHPSILALQTGKPINNEIMGVFNPIKNEYAWVNINAIPQIKHGESIPHQVLVIFEDITQRMHAEAALTESLSRNKALLDANPDMMFIFSADGIIVDYHSKVGSVLYLQPNEFLGKSLDAILPPEIAAMSHKKIDQVLGSGNADYSTYQLEIQHQNHHFEARYVLHNNNTVLAIVRDITEQINAKNALIHKEHILEAVAFAGNALLSENNLDINVNEALRRIGTATNQDRVYVFDYIKDPTTGEPLMSQRYEWVKDGISVQIDNQELQNILVNEIATRWFENMSKGEMIIGNVADFPDSEREILQAQDIVSIILFPIMVENYCWGFVGFDNCHSKSDWSSSEIAILSSTASSIGMAIIKQQQKDELLNAKQLLEEREERFRIVINNSSDRIVIINIDGTYRFVSQATEKMSGYTPQELDGKSFMQFIHPEDIQRVREIFTEGVQNPGKLLSVQYRSAHKTKTWVDSEAVGLNLINEPAIKGILISIRDITERKQAEISLRNSEQKYKHLQQLFRNLADNMPDMLWAKDLEKKYIFVNKAFCEKLLLANDTEEPIGKTDMYFANRQRQLHPENPNWHTFGEICGDTDTIVMNSGKSCQFDEYGNIKNKFLFLDAIKTPLRNENGEIIGTVGSGRDVTSRKRDEKILNIQYNIAMSMVSVENIQQLFEIVRNELKGLLDTTNFFVALYNSEYDTLKKIYWKDEIDQFTSWKASNSLSGQVVKQAKTLLLNRNEIDQFATENNLELIGTRAECWLGVPLKIDNQVFGAMVIQSYTNPNAFDNTTASLLEMIAHELSIFIEKQRIMEDLIKAKEKAEESERLKSAFLQNMSHEIRTPMNSISGFSQMLNKPGLSDEKRKNYTSIIITNSNQLLSIVNDILTISSIETKQENATIEKVCINQIIFDLLAIFKLQSSNKNIYIDAKTQLSTIQSETYTDKTKITQVLTNIISNALKFTHQGTIEFGYTLVETQNIASQQQIQFYVKDTGIGIKKEQLEIIFERFIQADSSIQSDYGGNGLGLSISKAFIELLGGHIWVESEPTQGSTFYFTIPYKPAHEIENNSTTIKNIEKASTVLIVDDVVNNSLLLAELLNDFGLKIIQVKDGKESIEICKTNPRIELVLMDIKMQGMDGHTAAMLIKELRPDLPIIAQSAYALEYEIAKYKGFPFDDYITKPIDTNELMAKVKKFIE